MDPTPEELESIRAFQDRRRTFRPLWLRNALLFGLPGFLLIVLGRDQRWMAWLGAALFLFAMARGALLALRHLRCPNCQHFQKPSWKIPYRRCAGCGLRLSVGVRDSA